jgi:chromosome segregation ATPase
MTFLAIGALSILYFQVADLSGRYGRIERDIEDYTADRERLAGTRVNLRAEIAELDSDRVRLTGEVREATNTRDRASAEQERAESERSKAEQDLRDLRDRKSDALVAIQKADVLRVELRSLRKSKIDLEKDLVTLGTEKSEIDLMINDLEASRDARRKEVEKLDTEVSTRQREASTLVQQEAAVQTTVRSGERRVLDLESQKTSLSSEKMRLEKRIDEKSREAATLDAQIETLERIKVQASLEMLELTSEIARQKSLLTDVLRKSETAKNKFDTLDTDHRSLMSRSDKLQRDADATSDNVARATKSLAIKQDETNRLQAEKSTLTGQVKQLTTDLQATLASTSAVKVDLQSRSDELQGVKDNLNLLLGRLGELSQRLENLQRQDIAATALIAERETQITLLTEQVSALNRSRETAKLALGRLQLDMARTQPQLAVTKAAAIEQPTQ